MKADKYMADKLLINARKPEGRLGNELIDNMNINHENLARWSVSHLDVSENDIILDIGCGGGVNVKRFLEMTANKVFGLDYSTLSVERSVELNQKAIDEGRCEIVEGSVSDLPFEDDTFDIVTAFETVYFWPDFVNDLAEVLRVLKDGGVMMIANEALPKKNDARQKELERLLDSKIYSKNELEDSLLEAGFEKVSSHIKKSRDSFTDDDSDWICLIAHKCTF